MFDTKHQGAGGGPREPLRIQVELTPEQMAALQELQAKTRVVSVSQVMRDALRVYEYLVWRSADHHILMEKRETGEQIYIEFL